MKVAAKNAPEIGDTERNFQGEDVMANDGLQDSG